MAGDTILVLSLLLIAVVLAHQYRSTIKGMLFEPGYYKRQVNP